MASFKNPLISHPTTVSFQTVVLLLVLLEVQMKVRASLTVTSNPGPGMARQDMQVHTRRYHGDVSQESVRPTNVTNIGFVSYVAFPDITQHDKLYIDTLERY